MCTTSKEIAGQSKKSISNVSEDEMSTGFAKAVTFSTSGVRRNPGVSKGPITVTIKQGDEHEEDSQEEKLTEMGTLHLH